MLHGGDFQVWHGMLLKREMKSGIKNSISNSQLNKFLFFHFPRVGCVRSPLPLPGQFGTTTNNASFGSY